MFYAALLTILAVMLLSGFVNTQANTQLDPTSVALDVRKGWCVSQTSACDTLCSSVTESNDCNSDTLTYGCQWTNYPTPQLAPFRGTMPTLICLQLFENCKKDAGTSLIKIDQCSTDYFVHCGTKFPVDFEPPATTSSNSTTASDQTSSTDPATQSTKTQSTSTDRSTSSDHSIPTDHRSTTGQPTSSVTSSSSSSSSRSTDTLATSTAPKSSATITALGAQNTTNPIPGRTPQKNDPSDVAIVGIVLGAVGAATIIGLAILWKLARLRARREKEKVEVIEEEQRSLRSNRGSTIMMREMSADDIRNHLAKLEAEGDGGDSEESENTNRLAELPTHFSRSHSRVFEME